MGILKKAKSLLSADIYNDTKASDYMYGRKGPWPQPCPVHPFGESPAVIHVPWSEWADWWLHIGSRYLITLGYTPVAFLKGLLRPGLEKVSDQEFTEFFERSMMSKFITSKIDEEDKINFGSYWEQWKDKSKLYIVDLSCISVVKTFEGIYASATKVLLHEVSPYKYEVLGIYVKESEEVFIPSDQGAWELAKYYVLQGAAIAATLVIHPVLHFPFDSINAITKTALPKEHILFKLIYPHLRFTLPLENAVLNFKSSLLMSKAWMSYAPYPGGSEGLRDLLVEGYRGIRGNDSYPAFQYPLTPHKVHSHYGDWQDRYYKAFYLFVSDILKDVEKGDIFIWRWANYISAHVPGFPNGDEIFKEDRLIKAVAMYLWNVSVAHSVDHYNYGNMDIRKVPLRIRQAPPHKGVDLMDRKKLTKFWDYGKYEMARILFFRANEVTCLIDCQYDFQEEHLQSRVAQFKSHLHQIDIETKEEGIQFIPLSKIAASIQY
ncbi:MAG: hypothetical protein CME60_12785 [Halobacteriovoraceae bacterium]|nr:hypothetical protein [Halobacteriovoraceae bacterium]|tara:strand:+ start:289 stop:1758 length:1470 start_codon:yes stop_codon:yes gene_type:complete